MQGCTFLLTYKTCLGVTLSVTLGLTLGVTLGVTLFENQQWIKNLGFPFA